MLYMVEVEGVMGHIYAPLSLPPHLSLPPSVSLFLSVYLGEEGAIPPHGNDQPDSGHQRAYLYPQPIPRLFSPMFRGGEKQGQMKSSALTLKRQHSPSLCLCLCIYLI